MGISINVGMKQDYSYLFQGLSTGSGSGMGNLNFLSDYAAIKNGSYGRLMKAYYAETGSSAKAAKSVLGKQSISTSSDDTKTIANIEKAAEGVKEAADDLLDLGTVGDGGVLHDAVLRVDDLEHQTTLRFVQCIDERLVALFDFLLRCRELRGSVEAVV